MQAAQDEEKVLQPLHSTAAVPAAPPCWEGSARAVAGPGAGTG